MKALCHRLSWLFLTGGILTCLQAAGVGWDELYRLDRLAEYRTAVKTGSVSSYDRSGGNDDGFSGKYSFVRKEEGGLVIADLVGPGVIYRIWTPTPTDDVLEFCFDGESTPRLSLKFRELFLGRHPGFPRPIVGYGVGGYFSYVPIPYAQSCKVRMRADKVQFYQINYATYPPEAGVQTFSPSPTPGGVSSLGQASQLWSAAGSDISAYTAPPGAKRTVSRAEVTVAPGETRTVFQSPKPGRIVGLRFSPAQAFVTKARDLVLRISFDDDTPSVQCPVGDFFGYAWGKPAMESLLVGVANDVAYCYLPMPFAKSALVEMVSERSAPARFTAEVVTVDVPRAPNEGKFAAVWRRENPTQVGQPFRFVEAEGRGHLVGCVLQAQGTETGQTLFFEGDDQTTIDGEMAIHGTGSEDFFNGGWYDVPDRWEKPLSFAMSGCLGYAKHLSRTGGYRFMVGDAYAFRHSLRHVIEHAGEGNRIVTDYAAVSYLYLDRSPAAAELPPLAARKVTDPREVIFPAWWQVPIQAFTFNQAALTRKVEKFGTEEVRSLSLTAAGADWFGPPFLSLTCDLPRSATYEIFLVGVAGPAQGKVQLFQDEIPVAAAVDFYAETRSKTGRLSLGRLALLEGKNNLMLKLVDKSEKSSGLALDLVQVVCVADAEGK